MGLIISSDKELRWIKGEKRRQIFYSLLVGVTFILMSYAFVVFVLPENTLSWIYRMTFFYAFLAFMLTVQILYKSQRYLKIIDHLLEERRDESFNLKSSDS